jgi:ABC-type branched-subunit amino acid transport system substrate-binding protein
MLRNNRLKRLIYRAGFIGALFLWAACAQAQTAEIVIGTHADLSGPLASWGMAVRNGLTLALEEANAAGGINGHKLRLIVEDDAYDPERAATAATKLVNKDHVFAIVSPLGTPTVQSALRAIKRTNTLYLFPITTTVDTLADEYPNAYALVPPTSLTIAAGLREILNQRGPLRVGVLSASDSFGHAVAEGAQTELTRRGLQLRASASFARGSKDFTKQLRALRQSGAEIVVLGTVATETIDVLRAAQRLRWNPVFLCSSACYTPEIVTLGGSAVNGLYAVGQVPIPYSDDRQWHDWSERYEKRFATAPTVQALTAYRNAKLFLAMLARSGATPTQAAFINALKTVDDWTDPVAGGVPISFTSDDRLGSHTAFLAQIRQSRWRAATP